MHNDGDRRRGFEILHDSQSNKSTAFTDAERDELGLRGLLPAVVDTLETQVERVMASARRKETDLGRYIFLDMLCRRNERLFYRALIDHLPELMPVVYTPTVGRACREFSHIFREPKGFYITPDDRGRISEMLTHWPQTDVRVIVVTDGERILGLGDLGANGMGIPLGKLALYTACAGIDPSQCLPVMLDVGTNNREIRDDPLYLGVRRERLTGEPYDGLVEEFVLAVQERFPQALIQFEDFLTPNAVTLLRRYRDRVLCFNDDIQGTAAVAIAGIRASTRITKVDFADLRVLFLGAGSAATGIGDLTCMALEEEGVAGDEARRRLWFIDSQGLITAGRGDLAEHKQPWAHDLDPANLLEAIDRLKPHVLIGATGHGGDFDESVVRAMSSFQERPAIFALSNPTSKAECTAEQAYAWSEGRALYASGSPFAAVEHGGRLHRPGQGNNAYIFPGVGLGAVSSGARHVTDAMFLAAAAALAESVTDEDLEAGSLYPALDQIRRVSLRVAVAVAEEAWNSGLARVDRPDDPAAVIGDSMYDPRY